MDALAFLTDLLWDPTQPWHRGAPISALYVEKVYNWDNPFTRAGVVAKYKAHWSLEIHTKPVSQSRTTRNKKFTHYADVETTGNCDGGLHILLDMRDAIYPDQFRMSGEKGDDNG